MSTMTKMYTISIPNDYLSESDGQAMISDVYGGDQDAASDNGFRNAYDRLADAAREAGLTYVASTDFGAEWEGTEAQIGVCRSLLPAWAYLG